MVIRHGSQLYMNSSIRYITKIEVKDKCDVVRTAYFRENFGVKMESIHSMTFGSNMKDKEATGNFKYNDQSEEITLRNQQKKAKPKTGKAFAEIKNF